MEISHSPKKQWSSSGRPVAYSKDKGDMRWYQIPLSSTRKPVSGIFSNRFQTSLQEYQQLRRLKRMKIGKPFFCLPTPAPSQGQPHEGAWALDKTSNELQMARPPKTMPALPPKTGVQAATNMPILLPTLKQSFFDHPLHRGFLHPIRHLCRPPLAPTHNSPKKAKIQVSGDMFPVDWSPPPVEFLNPKPPQSIQGTPTQAQFTSRSSESYVNSLDYLLQEKKEQALEQKWENLLLQDYPNFHSLDLNEDEVALTPEHRMLVERFSVSKHVIPQVHPGEIVFVPRRHPQQCVLDCSDLKPHSHLEGLFLSSSPAQQLSFLHRGLLSNLYLHTTYCPVPLLQWLFQLLTWPSETSSEAFGLLWDVSVDRLFHPSDEKDICMWCPTLQEIIEVFHSLGAQSPAGDPTGLCQHGRRLLKSEANVSWSEPQTEPQEMALDASLSYICKFLALCVLVQPGAYTDDHLLDLIKLLCQAGLDVGLRLQPKTDLQQLLLLLLESIGEWPGKLQPLCLALSWVSDHHHNLLTLVQFFLDVTARSRQLRSQLSLIIIAQMLGQQETLPLWQKSTQLSSLRRLLSLVRPSSLKQCLSSNPGTSTPCQEQQSKASAELDHKACYLCHSLLTLAGIVVSCQDITPDQWGELQLLCIQLDRHISTHIRESPQAMHRTKLKDLATQTYIRWQELLARCQPQVQYFCPWKDT